MKLTINDRAKESSVHTLQVNGTIATITRIKIPRFVLKLNMATDEFELDGKSHSMPVQSYIKKAIAFAKSNIIIK